MIQTFSVEFHPLPINTNKQWFCSDANTDDALRLFASAAENVDCLFYFSVNLFKKSNLCSISVTKKKVTILHLSLFIRPTSDYFILIKCMFFCIFFFSFAFLSSKLSW